MNAMQAEDFLKIANRHMRCDCRLRSKVLRVPTACDSSVILYEGRLPSMAPPFYDPNYTFATAIFDHKELASLKSREDLLDFVKLKADVAHRDCLELYAQTRLDAAQRHGPSLPSVTK
jgi:hypothetical protein